MPVHMTAHFKVRPESVEIVQAAIAEFVDYITRNEPSTLVYTSLQDAEDSTRFFHFILFEDEAAEEHHANSEAVKRFMSILQPECIEPMTFTSYQLVASTEE
jgi:quinol monooxygenase YgiN